MKSNLRLLLLPICFSLLGACASTKHYNVQVELARSLAGASVQADVVGVNKESMATLDAVPVSKYWKSNSVRQNLSAHSFRFGGGAGNVQTLSINDPAWGKWGSPTDLVVLVDLPGVFEDLPGAADPRRKTLSLDSSKWGNTDTIKLQIEPTGIQVVTP